LPLTTLSSILFNVECVNGVDTLSNMCYFCSSHLDVFLSTDHLKLFVLGNNLLSWCFFIIPKSEPVVILVAAFLKKCFLLPVLRRLFLRLKFRLVTIKHFFFPVD
jgi:ubiquitin C-terminal hydrolase